MVTGAKPPFLRRVRIRGYKSIAFCDVSLEPLTILVGRNGSGKSNFVDALAFLRDVIVLGAREAVTKHGEREAILHKGAGNCRVAIEVELGGIPQEGWGPWAGRLSVEIDLPEKDAPRITREYLCLESPAVPRRLGYTVAEGAVSWIEGDPAIPPITHWRNPDRVFLGWCPMPPFEALVDRFRTVLAYSFHPDAIRSFQKEARGHALERNGWNIASVIETTREAVPWPVERAGQYLSVITPGVRFEAVRSLGGQVTPFFRVEREEGDPNPREFPADGMSDGTLRAFAALIATFQFIPPRGYPTLVMIEEPETGLHPEAGRALMSAMDEATLRTQILITTHSPDILDAEDVSPSNIRVVELIDGRTVIGPVDEAYVEIVARKLNTLGGLGRYGDLHPDLDDRDRQDALAANGEVVTR